MLDEAEYASDTDESDEDYKPADDGSDVPSEVESDGEPENDVEKEASTTKRGRSTKRSAVEPTPVVKKRTRQSEDVVSSSTTEKDVLVDDEDENEDALWASFLNKTGQATGKSETVSNPNEASKTSTSEPSQSTSNGSSSKTVKEKENPTSQAPSSSTEVKKIVTEIYEFAGEKVEVKKEIKVTETEKSSASNEASSKKTATKTGPTLPFNRPRTSGSVGGGGGGSGLSSILGQIGKKNKLSILEKSKLDWGGFKQTEGIDEELQTFNKGRDGYLERQDFLQRTDVRQFEIEKSLRAANRKKL